MMNFPRIAVLPRWLLLLLHLLACAAGPALAATTNIAQVPLLNIAGTGTVKPNLMLLFDNSGSMDQTYTPDYVNDNLCRSRLTLSAGITACNVGHPPFMSPDFNRQYYNPRIRYQAPIQWDGTYYPDMTAAQTSNWSNVPSDGFGRSNTNLYGSSDSAINLLTQFPDLKWCNASDESDCRVNSATYTYPDNAYYNPVAISGGPYYFNIAVSEYCRDERLTTCTSVAAGGAAPAGYPVPATVRWCSNRALTACQAKRVGSYVYPKYSTPPTTTIAHGTITLGATVSTSAMQIASVAVIDPAAPTAPITISNGAVNAATGTNTAARQQALASQVAAGIIARTGLGANSYWACVRTPTGSSTVPACSSLGIPLTSDNVVAVIPILCMANTKSLTNCSTFREDSTLYNRQGWGLEVNAPPVQTTPATTGQPPTALLRIGGRGTMRSTGSIANIRLGSTTITGTVALRNMSPAQAAVAIVQAINASSTRNTHRAYLGGDATTGVCANEPATTVCIVNVNATSNGAALTGTVSGENNVTFDKVDATSIVEGIPVTTTALSSLPSAFSRVNIVPGRSYPKATARSDCVAQTSACTYDEEMTNFANWYAYYKNRLQMMKTSVGIAFAAINANYRVGFVRLSQAGAGGEIDMKPADFTGTARSTWYSTLYNTTSSGSTPIRTAMDNVGRMFANLAPYDYASGQQVVQFPCQQNFLILTTDGYWNGSSTNNVVNNDNAESPSRFCTWGRGCVDARAQSQPSISDVALHWYNGGSSTGTVSLRPDLEPDMTKPGQVPAAEGENTHLHMNTYTLGLGMDGVMTYEPNYDTAPKAGGDFYNLITRVQTGCPWNDNGPYVWPNPDVTNTGNTVQERVDDLWHAAINGHGKYFSANEPREVVEGLSSALANMQVTLGAASAAATSTPNISLQDNDIFSDTFTTVKWYGELSDRKIDPTTGIVSATTVWTTTDTVGEKVAAASDTRAIYMLGSGGLKEFRYEGMTAQEKAWFNGQCPNLPQCTLLSLADRALVNSGDNMVNWLRGQQQHANDRIFRAYSMSNDTPSIPIVLGDIASSKPAYVRDPRKAYTDNGYPAFRDAQTAARPVATVFTAANDGMLHAFSAADGEEVWAYVPRITMKKLPALSSTTYATNHQFTTDGSPEVADVYINGAWRTVLVAGLNAGGRGYYALDITNPRQPRQLWELCADAAVCANAVPNLGLSFGNPQFGTWKDGSGADRWVVFLTSGYNNVPGVDGVDTGDGKGYLFIVDVATGAVLKTVSTNSGDTTTPSGLAKITAITADPNGDPLVTYIYGGDNDGRMWRFDLTATDGSVGVLKMGDAGAGQPITTRPDVTLCAVDGSSVPQRVALFGTGRLLDVPDTTSADVQSLYALKDTGAYVNVRGAAMEQQTLGTAGTGTNTSSYQITEDAADLNLKSGWFFDWRLNPGERMNIDPKIVSGVANVVTNLPTSSSSCSVGGTSNAYAVDVCRGVGVNGLVVGGTLSNTSAAVGFIIVRLPSGQLKMIATTAKGETLTRPIVELDSEGAHPVGWRRVKGE
ncbi:pilus assembly protein [Pseudoduganella umbonata]|uniref:Type IV pilus assembly protein PilY1 n=2 Tax=Pseudoduganella umbonata TaxID=864828 RepID=A0A7W5HBW6_9BURK|nr:PilC/PilY family type IV pilus protein [Pseudoduganella umbonata]MBB3221382.1 type IV pilus assembly protein PilY1 [Pseudoduganella umbonata]